MSNFDSSAMFAGAFAEEFWKWNFQQDYDKIDIDYRQTNWMHCVLQCVVFVAMLPIPRKFVETIQESFMCINYYYNFQLEGINISLHEQYFYQWDTDTTECDQKIVISFQLKPFHKEWDWKLINKRSRLRAAIHAFVEFHNFMAASLSFNY